MKNNSKLFNLCNEYLEEKKKAEHFDKVIKKEFYKNVSEFFEDGESNITASNEKNLSKSFSITKVESNKIIYDLEKLKKDLSKETYKGIVDKKITITNEELLFKTLKECGIPSSEVKKFLSIEEVVNEKVLEQYLQVGKVEKKVIVKDSKVEKAKEPYYLVKEINNEK